MKPVTEKKVAYFVDESGDPNFFGKNGKDLVTTGNVSPVFIVGYMETSDMNSITKSLTKIRNEIMCDDYLKDIPSVKEKSINHFHAKDDCPEVREKLFKAISKMDIKSYIIVARKNNEQFLTRFKGKQKKFYEYLVEKLFENRLHLYSEIDIYFSKMGNIVREQTMSQALDKAKQSFQKKWGMKNSNEIRLFIQQPSQIIPLQVIDYLLWAVYRVYTKREMRYYNFLKDKISMVHDIFDTSNYPNNYYHREKNPLDIKKISPFGS